MNKYITTCALALSLSAAAFGQGKYLTGESDLKANANASQPLSVHKMAPTFSLKTLNGKTISSEDLKGKVVIIDFWATWCGPCKKSLPGMQEAVDKYKKDDDVVFLFVNTWEKGTEKDISKKVKKFIKDNKYKFTVLLDEPNTTSRTKFTLVDQFEVKSIPTKIIIDKQGRISETVKGFDQKGGNEKLLKELDELIEKAKTNS